MSITGSIVVFILLWWLVLFIILPRNISSQQERGSITKGTDPGAPASPKITKKLILTTIISLLLFAIIYILTYFEVLSLRRILS